MSGMNPDTFADYFGGGGETGDYDDLNATLYSLFLLHNKYETIESVKSIVQAYFKMHKAHEIKDVHRKKQRALLYLEMHDLLVQKIASAGLRSPLIVEQAEQLDIVILSEIRKVLPGIIRELLEKQISATDLIKLRKKVNGPVATVNRTPEHSGLRF